MSQGNQLSVPPSVHMLDLVGKPHYAMAIARNHDILRDIIVQIGLDVANAENRDIIGPTILGLKHVQDILLLFKAKGDVLIAAERREDNRNANRNAETKRNTR